MPRTTFLNVKNNVASLLAAEIAAGASSLSVSTGDGAKYPSTNFEVTIDNEIFLVSTRTTDTFAVTGAQEGTSQAVHLVGTEVRLNMTAKIIDDITDAINLIEKYADYGLSFFGAVTEYTDTTHFKVSSLAGLGASTFLPAAGTPYEIFVFKADGAAPQGEQKPVVAYTTGDGTFQHAAFTSPLAVDDEVLIIHPLLASLGTKATAAATGAVSNAKAMMAYQKQVVTVLLNGTYGLSNLKALIDAIQTDVGDPTGETLVSISAKIGNIARSLDVIIGARWDSSGDLGTDIAQLLTYTDILDDGTNGLASIKSLLDAIAGYITTEIADILEDTGETLPATLTTIDNVVDGIQTDLSNASDGLGALKILIEANTTLIGAMDDTPSAGILVDTKSVLALLRRIAQGSGLSILGDITGYTDINNLVVEDFKGWEDGYFIGWTAYIDRDNAGAGAIPQGSRAVVTGYTSSTGALVLADGLTAASGIGDHLRLIHPILSDPWNLRGGPEGIQDIIENQAAELDVARGTSGAVSVDGGEDDVYNESSDNEFVLQELRVDLNNMAEGDTIVFKTYTTEGGNERKISEDAANTFEGVQDPARVEIIGSANQVWGREGIRVAAVKVGGTTRTVTAFYRDAKRGS